MSGARSGWRRRLGRLAPAALAAGLAAATAGCGARTPEPRTVRLVDLFASGHAVVLAKAPAPAPHPTAEWRFAAAPRAAAAPGAAAALGWQAGPGVADLAVRPGGLSGRATDDFPVLHLPLPAGGATAAGGPPGAGAADSKNDLLYAVEIRLRASAGANLAVQLMRADPLDLRQAVAAGRTFPWRITTPIVPGEAAHTYVLSAAANPFPVHLAAIRHLLVRPTDAAGATFAVESIRLVTQPDFLAGIPSGVRWQGLSEIYHESLVTHAPEALRMTLDVAHDAFLDLAVGTLAARPVTFRVELRQGGGPPHVLVDRKVAQADRWEPAPVDLRAWGGQRVELVLRLASDEPGAVGFWGSPVVRRRLPERAAAGGAPAAGPRGVILIFADTLRRDHLPTYGYARPTAPALTRLAGGGAVFRNCQAEATWTKVAAPSILTSLYPPTHGVKDFEDRLPDAAVTVAEAFRDAGYATLSLSSVIFTGRFSNLQQGFEELHESTSLKSLASSKTAAELVGRLVPWIASHRQAPFFVLLHVTDPHDPYRPAAPYDRLWLDAARDTAHQRDQEIVQRHIADPVLKAYTMPSRDEVVAAGVDPAAYEQAEIDLYDGAIRGMDDALGNLDAALRRMGLADDVLCALVSDHGEEFFEHGHMFHGQSTYEELTEVPLIFWGAGVKPATVVDQTVETVDLMPTLLTLAGVPVPKAAQGRSLAALVGGTAPDGGGAGAAPAFSIKAATHDVFGPPPRDSESIAVLAGGWKLIHNLKRPAARPEYELYDHRADRLDQHDVAAANPAVVERLGRLVDEWQRRSAARRLPPDVAGANGVSSAELERLRSLGYIR
jgi:choline-sulfatase